MSPPRTDNRVAAGVGLLLVTAFVAFVAIFGLEKVPDERLVGATGEARFNDFLAAERLLSRLGVPTTSVNAIEVPADTHTALLVLTPSRVLSQSRIDAVHAWVEAGGHLVVAAPVSGGSLRRLLAELARKAAEQTDEETPEEAPEPEDEEEEDEDAEEPIEDPLLADFGVTILRMDAWKLAVVSGYVGPADSGAEEQAGKTVVFDENPWELGFVPLGTVDLTEPAVLQMSPWPEGATTIGPRHTVRDPDGSSFYVTTPLALQMPVGRGWLTVLPSPDPWDNHDIGKADHARVLWTLLTRPGQPAAASLVYAHDAPSLWTLLWAAVWPAVLGGGVLLAAWLWSASRRFGPLLPAPAPAVRSLGEHIEATGRYLWRTNHRLELLASAQRAARARLLRGAALGDDGAEALTTLAVELTGLDPVDVRAALTATDLEHPIQFTRHMRALVRILGARGRRSP